MMRVTFNESDIQALRYERFHHPHPRVQQKAEALLMKSHGLKHKDICKFIGISNNTLREYLREYQEGSIARIKETGSLVVPVASNLLIIMQIIRILSGR